MTQEELENKFRKLANYILDKRTTDEMAKTINRLERIEDINVLLRMLTNAVTKSHS